MHNQDELNSLIDKLKNEKKELNSNIPLAIKVSPDLNDDQINGVSKIIMEQEIGIIIVSNTTDKNRENLKNINKLEKGGLSGKPIEKISNEAISKFYKILKNKKNVDVIGPFPSIPFKVKGNTRNHLVIKSNTKTYLNRVLKFLTKEIENWPETKKVKWSYDIDPYDMS